MYGKLSSHVGTKRCVRKEAILGTFWAGFEGPVDSPFTSHGAFLAVLCNGISPDHPFFVLPVKRNLELF